MANILGELFQNQANAIREGLGDIGGIAPLETPSLIRQIVSMIGTGGGGGGGGSIAGTGIKFSHGSFDTERVGVYQQTIDHGLDERPDFIIVFYSDVNTYADKNAEAAKTYPLMMAFGFSNKFSGEVYHLGFKTYFGMASTGSSLEYDSSLYHFGDDKFKVGVSNTSAVGGLFAPNSNYQWIAISGLGSTDGGSSADERVKYVTFVYEENGETKEYRYPVIKGDTCHNPATLGLINPTKKSTDQYDYTFYDWGASDGGAADDTILQNITEDKTVYAIYSSTLRSYTITYLDSDGETFLYEETPILYGSWPTYVPSKPGHTFDGWIPERASVTGDATYIAKWTEEATIASGYCGDAVMWKLYETGELKIYGTGEMTNYSSNDSRPWHDYVSQISSVEIEDGVTSIGDRAFATSTVVSVTIPDSVTKIGNRAFDACDSLSSISIPDSVTSIEQYAFYKCSSLTSIVIPSGVTEIPHSAIRGCSSLASITLLGKVTSFGQYAFADAIMTSFTIPNSVTAIGLGAFYACKNLTSINIPASVKTIGKTAFTACNSLSTAYFGNKYGWKLNTTGSTSSYTQSIDCSNATTAATYLRSTYAGYYWYI